MKVKPETLDSGRKEERNNVLDKRSRMGSVGHL